MNKLKTAEALLKIANEVLTTATPRKQNPRQVIAALRQKAQQLVQALDALSAEPTAENYAHVVDLAGYIEYHVKHDLNDYIDFES